MTIDRRGFVKALALCGAAGALKARPGDWSEAVEVRHEDDVCISYQARLDGPYLVVRATIGPGWHTFAMDNKIRADEKLAGKPALSVDRATEITPAGLQVTGPWLQTAPKDFSHLELRWFSWGFEHQAIFAAPARRTAGAAKLTIRGQACTQSICKNIDVSLALPPGKGPAGGPAEINLKDLIQVR